MNHRARIGTHGRGSRGGIGVSRIVCRNDEAGRGEPPAPASSCVGCKWDQAAFDWSPDWIRPTLAIPAKSFPMAVRSASRFSFTFGSSAITSTLSKK